MYGGESSSNGYNIESPGDTCGFDQATDQVNVTTEDLSLGPLADNGGPTETHALLPGSVAIDWIEEALAAHSTVPVNSVTDILDADRWTRNFLVTRHPEAVAISLYPSFFICSLRPCSIHAGGCREKLHESGSTFGPRGLGRRM